MSENEIAKLYGELKAVNAKIDNITTLFNQAAHGDGFVRCGKHSSRLQQMEDKVELAHARVSGVKKLLLTGLIAVASMAANYAWSMLQAAAQK